MTEWEQMLTEKENASGLKIMSAPVFIIKKINPGKVLFSTVSVNQQHLYTHHVLYIEQVAVAIVSI